MVKAKLVLDLGNSETRAVLRVGDIRDKSRMEHSFNLSNRFGVVLESLPITEDYNETNTTALTIDELKIGEGSLPAGTYVNGLMSDREFANMQIRPTALNPKYNSDVTILTVVTAVKTSALWMREYFKSKGQEHELETLINQIDWELALLLPPSQVNEGTKKLTEALVKEIPVTFELPKATACIRITKVEVFAEGTSAYMAVLVKKSNKGVRANKAFMTKAKVLIIDIGAGTTDIILIDNNTAVETSKYTIDQGGNNIMQKLKQKTQIQVGAKLADSVFEDAVITGKVKQGIKEHDVTQLLINSKREVAMVISNEIRGYLESSNLSVNSVDYILVVGGGSMKSKNSDVPAISKYILEGLKRFAPHIGEIDIEDMTEVSEQVGFGADSEDNVSRRDLNIVGTGVMLDLKELREIKKEEEAKANA